MRQFCKAMVNNSLIQEIARVKPPRSQRRRLAVTTRDMILYREEFAGAVKRSRLKYKSHQVRWRQWGGSDPRVSGIRQILASGDGGQPGNTDGALRFALRVVEIT
jgi:hypothetical protein